MRLTPVASAILMTALVTPALSQSSDFLETHSEAARRRQAETYGEAKARPNPLAAEQTRPLGEAAPSRFSNPRAGRGDDPPNLPRECAPNQMMCR